jgi:serine/threonine protein kinase
MTNTCKRCGLIHPLGMSCLTQTIVPGEREELVMGTLLAGRYLLVRTIHHGGMSVVYLAEDSLLNNRQVVLKELRLPRDASAEERREAEAWFARESYILSSLKNPLIPEFFSTFREAGTSFIVQEYVAGENLNDVIAKHGPLAENVVADWAVALCGLLSYLHGLDEPVLFRDLKPANILLSDAKPSAAGELCPLRVVDFGIARHYQPDAVGTVIGTPGYAPPEQYQGLATPQSDIYALGATLHRLLTGYDPEHGTPFTFPAVRSLNPSVSPEMAAIVERAVRLHPAERYPSAQAMGEALFPLAWVRGAGWTGRNGSASSSQANVPAAQNSFAQRAFRWTALVVCVMMVAPGLLNLLSGANRRFDDTSTGGFASSYIGPSSTDSSCLPAYTDAAGGPYPAVESTECLNQPLVQVSVVPDAFLDVGFSPSNITVTRGTTVQFYQLQQGCTIQFTDAASAKQDPYAGLEFDKPGTYRYACQEFPNVGGVIHVR